MKGGSKYVKGQQPVSQPLVAGIERKYVWYCSGNARFGVLLEVLNKLHHFSCGVWVRQHSLIRHLTQPSKCRDEPVYRRLGHVRAICPQQRGFGVSVGVVHCVAGEDVSALAIKVVPSERVLLRSRKREGRQRG